ncbi:MAG: phage head closure protein [Hyphomicrobiaceae bacterium]
MSELRIGALRHRVVLEAPDRTDDGGGGGVVTWLPVSEVWASVVPTSGTETVVAEQIAGRVTHEVLVRHRGGIVPAMRFRFGSRIFEILAVLDVGERRRVLRCLCREELL